MAKIVGELHSTINGYDIHKWITGYAYGRNGNAHNPTPRVQWMIYKCGQCIGSEFTLRAAKQFVSDVVTEVTK